MGHSGEAAAAIVAEVNARRVERSMLRLLLCFWCPRGWIGKGGDVCGLASDFHKQSASYIHRTIQDAVIYLSMIYLSPVYLALGSFAISGWVTWA